MYVFPLQVEQVFAVDSMEGAIDNLRGRREPWAQMALQNIGERCVEDLYVQSGGLGVLSGSRLE